MEGRCDVAQSVASTPDIRIATASKLMVVFSGNYFDEFGVMDTTVQKMHVVVACHRVLDFTGVPSGTLKFSFLVNSEGS